MIRFRDRNPLCLAASVLAAGPPLIVQLFLSFLRPRLPQWGIADAEIKVPSVEIPDLTNVLPVARSS